MVAFAFTIIHLVLFEKFIDARLFGFANPDAVNISICDWLIGIEYTSSAIGGKIRVTSLIDANSVLFLEVDSSIALAIAIGSPASPGVRTNCPAIREPMTSMRKPAEGANPEIFSAATSAIGLTALARVFEPLLFDSGKVEVVSLCSFVTVGALARILPIVFGREVADGAGVGAGAADGAGEADGLGGRGTRVGLRGTDGATEGLGLGLGDAVAEGLGEGLTDGVWIGPELDEGFDGELITIAAAKVIVSV